MLRTKDELREWTSHESSSGKYWRNTRTGEASRQEPRMMTEDEKRKRKVATLDLIADYLRTKSDESEECYTVGEYLLEVFDDSKDVKRFEKSLSEGMEANQLKDIYHLIHASVPFKKKNYSDSLEYRERMFDSNPPEGWTVRESSSNIGSFYYLNLRTAETSISRPEDVHNNSRCDSTPKQKTLSGSGGNNSDSRIADLQLRPTTQTVPSFLRSFNRSEQSQQLTSLSKSAVKKGDLHNAASKPSDLLELQKKTRNQGNWEMPTRNKTANGMHSSSWSYSNDEPPISKCRDQLLDAIVSHQCLIVVGETGSGKTTQIPQYIVNSKKCYKGVVACTQPRRVSATSIAKRVASEMRTAVGGTVGYGVRFDNKSSDDTIIKYVTDGVLLRELLTSPTLQHYSTVIIDEAHERTITTDMLLFLLRKLLKTRPDLNLIISSATLEASKFSSYFNNAAVFYIPGRAYPVELLYIHQRESDWYAMTLKVVFEIHTHEPEGDILVFLTGQDEIDSACQICFEWYQRLVSEQGDSACGEMLILPLYSALPSDNQSEVFEAAPEGMRKVIFSTNIAETSLTINGVVYVVDCGFVKMKFCDSSNQIDTLLVVPESKAAAKQRAGRAGRTAPGKCFRLYTEISFDQEMEPHTTPEIQRSNLDSIVLMIISFESEFRDNFREFLDPPPVNTVFTSLYNLYHIGALDDEGKITKTGRRMLRYPLQPNHSKMMVAAEDLQKQESAALLAQVASIVGLVTSESQIFYRPRTKQEDADACKRRFASSNGDHVTLLNAFTECYTLKRGSLYQWCSDNFVNARAIESAVRIAEQLYFISIRSDVVRETLRDIHSPFSLSKDLNLLNSDTISSVLAAGSFLRCARKHSVDTNGMVQFQLMSRSGSRKGDGVQLVAAHPTSVFSFLSWEASPDWIIYDEIINTKREYANTISLTTPPLLYQYAKSLFEVSQTVAMRSDDAQNSILKHEMRTLRAAFDSNELNANEIDTIAGIEPQHILTDEKSKRARDRSTTRDKRRKAFF